MVSRFRQMGVWSRLVLLLVGAVVGAGALHVWAEAAAQPGVRALPRPGIPKPGKKKKKTDEKGRTNVQIALPRRPIPVLLANKGELRGYVDLHTHPMSHLGFGRKALHGAPDVGIIVPKGTLRCDDHDRRASSMAEALGGCGPTHGGWGLDNQCGDYLRATVISGALDGAFRGNTSMSPERPHPDHDHVGFPSFPKWPHHSSKLHQQMWWEWLKRAKEGGLRVIVALTVNSETLAAVLNGDAPYDDRSVADVQIDETIRFVDRHRDFMEIARSPADLRRIVGANKLAVVLGMEVDRLGNFGKPGVRTDDAAVRAEIERLHTRGIRYVFPIHLIDNAFGGAAVYSHLFNFANRHQTGNFYSVASDRTIGFNANINIKTSAHGRGLSAPFGLDSAALLGVYGLLQGVGHLPAPCMNDLLKCQPPPGKLLCCGSYSRVLDILQPSPAFDLYKTVRPGHVNAKGLTRLGEVAIREMMRLGMLIDVDHMSERSTRDALRVAGDYPLLMGHNAVRPHGGHERNVPADILRNVLQNGGMLGLGTALEGNDVPSALVANFNTAMGIGVRSMPKGAFGLGTDVNGFEPLPHHGRPQTPASSDQFYNQFFAASAIKTKSVRPNGQPFDYIREGGVSHYGLMPEFLFDVASKPAPRGGHSGADLNEQLMSSAEHFARLWETAESKARSVSTRPSGGTYSYNLPPLSDLCPHQNTRGDLEFAGNGPAVRGTVTLSPSRDGSRLEASITFSATETRGDRSTVQGQWTVPVGEIAPPGLRYTSVSPARSMFSKTLSGGGRNEVFQGCDGDTHTLPVSQGPVSRVALVGDTGGADISSDANCHCDTRIVSIEFRSVQATLAPR